MTDLADALDNLRVHQQQLDDDGIMVGVSREALNEVIRAFGALSLRQSHSTGAVVKTAASCPTCHGTGDHCGNPDFGQCDDCGGTGILQSLDLSDFPPKEAEVTVTEEMAKGLFEWACDDLLPAYGIEASRFDSELAEACRVGLVAALSRKG